MQNRTETLRVTLFFTIFFIFEGVGGALGAPFTPGANPGCDGPVCIWISYLAYFFSRRGGIPTL